jgi:hypothetical protein
MSEIFIHLYLDEDVHVLIADLVRGQGSQLRPPWMRATSNIQMKTSLPMLRSTAWLS